MFQVFATPEEPALPTPVFLKLASFLLTRAPSDTPEIMNDLEEALETANDGALKEFVKFEEFAELPIVEKLR